MLGEIIINDLHNNTLNFTFAMVKWYDYCESDNNEDLEIYGCPQLLMLKSYDIVLLDSITYGIHIIPRFHKENRFLMNRNIF